MYSVTTCKHMQQEDAPYQGSPTGSGKVDRYDNHSHFYSFPPFQPLKQCSFRLVTIKPQLSLHDGNQLPILLRVYIRLFSYAVDRGLDDVDSSITFIHSLPSLRVFNRPSLQ